MVVMRPHRLECHMLLLIVSWSSNGERRELHCKSFSCLAANHDNPTETAMITIPLMQKTLLHGGWHSHGRSARNRLNHPCGS